MAPRGTARHLGIWYGVFVRHFCALGVEMIIRATAALLGTLLVTSPVLATPALDYSTYLAESPASNHAADASGNLYVATLRDPSGSVALPVLITVWKIDPTQSGASSLVWSFPFSTGIYGLGNVQLTGLAVDEASGETAVAGFLLDTGSFPNINGYASAVNNGSFVAVVNAAGDAVSYSTGLGGDQTWAWSVSFAGGTVAVTGATDDAAFPTRNGLATGNTGGAFVTAFDPSQSGASSLLYSTRFANNADAAGLHIAAGGGDLFVLGMNAGAGYAQIPVTAGALSTTPDNLWLSRFDPGATGDAGLIYATYLGGSGTESEAANVTGLDADATGHAYVTGGTASPDFPISAGAFQPTHGGSQDVFVTKLNPTGTGVVFSTFVGAAGVEVGHDIAAHPDGSASFTGYSASGLTFPLGECALAAAPHASNAGFIAHLSSDGSSLALSDYFLDVDVATGDYVAAVGDGTVAAMLRTAGNFPVVGGFQDFASMPYVVAVMPTSPRCGDLTVTIPGAVIVDVLVDDVTTVTIEVNNAGPHDIDAQLTIETTPPSLTVLGGLAAEGDCDVSGDPVLCDAGVIAAGTTSLVEIYVSTAVAGPALITASAITADIDLDDTNNDDQVELLAAASSGGCGSITYQGECAGNLLRFCVDRGTAAETLYEVECAGVFPGVSGVCVEIDPVYGHDCAVPVGDNCFYTDDLGNPVFALCEGVDAGCVVDNDTGDATCTDVGFQCAAPVGDEFEPLCVGDNVVFDCNARQPTLLDCAALGGNCFDAACIGLPNGAPCDEQLACDGTLVCHAPTDTCVDPADLCDPSTYAASCTGDQVSFCLPSIGVVQQLDCTGIFTNGDGACGTPFTCLDADDGGGACLALGEGCHGDGEGAPCDLATGILCGVGFGCLLEEDASGNGRVNRCRAVGTCAHGDAHAGCVGEVATSCYTNGTITAAEAAGVDCAAFNSTCATYSDSGFPYCAAALGDDCDASQATGGLFGCAPGLVCVLDLTTGSGVCEIPPDDGGPRDDGGPQNDGGRPPPTTPDDGGCGCRGTGMPPVAMALALLVAVRRRRRRR